MMPGCSGRRSCGGREARGGKIAYEYGFGAGWVHEIALREKVPRAPGAGSSGGCAEVRLVSRGDPLILDFRNGRVGFYRGLAEVSQ